LLNPSRVSHRAVSAAKTHKSCNAQMTKNECAGKIPLYFRWHMCTQAFRRSVDHRESHDHIVDKVGGNGNALLPEADAKMEEHSKLVSSDEKEVREVITARVILVRQARCRPRAALCELYVRMMDAAGEVKCV